VERAPADLGIAGLPMAKALLEHEQRLAEIRRELDATLAGLREMLAEMERGRVTRLEERVARLEGGAR
jgi:phage shock protein A